MRGGHEDESRRRRAETKMLEGVEEVRVIIILQIYKYFIFCIEIFAKSN